MDIIPGKLCYEPCPAFKFKAKILKVKKFENYFKVLLNQTYFYPEGGGQPSDIGNLNQLKIFKVIEADGQIWHLMKNRPMGENAELEINQTHRTDYCEQHTGQHIISSVFWKIGKHKTLSVHMGSEHTAIELDTQKISETILVQVEEIVNSIIKQNLPVKSEIIKIEQISKYPVRKKITLTDQKIRLVIIKDIDCIACCGLHLPDTGSVGLVKICGVEKIRGHIRIKWKIGKRAYMDYSKKTKLLEKLQNTLSCHEDFIETSVKMLQENLSHLKTLNNSNEKTIANFLLKDITDANNLQTKKQIFTKIFCEQNDSLIKKIIKQLISSKNIYFCIFNTVSNKTLWSIGCSEDQEINFTDLQRNLLPIIDGKGGGKNPLYSGIAKNPKRLDHFCFKFRNFIEN